MPRIWNQLRSYIFLSDEEMVKKDDDHSKAKNPAVLRNAHWQPSTNIPSRRHARRFVVLLLVGVGVWVLMRYVSLDLGYNDNARSRYSYSQDDARGVPQNQASSAGSRRLESRPLDTTPLSSSPPLDKDSHERTFDGPVKFHELAASLHAIAATRGTQPHNQNVLFFAGSLESASTLLPMACEMGRELRSYVHFAFTGRSDIDLKDLQKVNGIDSSCQLLYHDARADFVDISTEERMQHVTARALFHINNYMHPQAVIVDGTSREEDWFRKGTRAQLGGMGVPLIELPDGARKSLSWIAKLDSASLAAWDKLTFDILIQAPSDGEGSLLRLLKSLSEVDFAASQVPHLTIELSAKIAPFTETFLQRFRWPPLRSRGPNSDLGATQLMSLRHRIPRQRMSEEESAVRFLESFWPRMPEHSHVIVLSPQAELSPHFFLYAKFAMLEYRYSNSAHANKWDRRLLGISLAVPKTSISGETEFKPPKPLKEDRDGRATSFLWQAPHSDAMIFMGDKWAEMHSFLSHVLEKQHSESPPALLAEKHISKHQPAWAEQMLRLSRARGYFTLYPSAETASTIATIHDDAFHPPEEYGKDLEPELINGVVGEHEGEIAAAPLLGIQDSLANHGALLPYESLPVMSWDGQVKSLNELDTDTIRYMVEWRHEVGGCVDSEAEASEEDYAAKGLFCT